MTNELKTKNPRKYYKDLIYRYLPKEVNLKFMDNIIITDQGKLKGYTRLDNDGYLTIGIPKKWIKRTFLTFLHELGHIFWRHLSPENYKRIPRWRKEQEAILFVQIICEREGIKLNQFEILEMQSNIDIAKSMSKKEIKTIKNIAEICFNE